MKNMRGNYILMAAVAIALAAAGCATDTGPAVEIVMDPNAPVTEAPGNYGIGTTFAFDHTLNGETARYTTSLVERREEKGREVYVFADSIPHRDPGFPCDGASRVLVDVESDSFVACAKDGEILARTNPNNGRYDWPLEVGKSWRRDYFYTDKAIHPDWSGTSWEEWPVVAWEEVTVPAGTFMAYKIVRTKTKWEVTNEDVAINWYAPEVPATVKIVWLRGSKDGYGAAEHTWELVSHDLK